MLTKFIKTAFGDTKLNCFKQICWKWIPLKKNTSSIFRKRNPKIFYSRSHGNVGSARFRFPRWSHSCHSPRCVSLCYAVLNFPAPEKVFHSLVQFDWLYTSSIYVVIVTELCTDSFWFLYVSFHYMESFNSS